MVATSVCLLRQHLWLSVTILCSLPPTFRLDEFPSLWFAGELWTEFLCFGGYSNLTQILAVTFFFSFFFSSFSHTHSMWKYPGQRSNPSHSCRHAGSLTRCKTAGAPLAAPFFLLNCQLQAQLHTLCCWAFCQCSAVGDAVRTDEKGPGRESPKRQHVKDRQGLDTGWIQEERGERPEEMLKWLHPLPPGF